MLHVHMYRYRCMYGFVHKFACLAKVDRTFKIQETYRLDTRMKLFK